MKLVLCTHCSDIFKLQSQARGCRCGHAWGRYTDDNQAIYGGESAVPLGINNSALQAAVTQGHGAFEGFVFLPDSPTFKRHS